MGSFLNEPNTLSTLPPEIRFELTHYLSNTGLQTLRTVSADWDFVAKYRLRDRLVQETVIFDQLETLIRYNETFVNGDVFPWAFRFKLPVLTSPDTLVHLDTFGPTVGHRDLPTLVLDFKKSNWKAGEVYLAPEERVTISKNVTLLLAKVKGHVEALQLVRYSGLPAATLLGDDKFPALKILHVHLNPNTPAESLPISERDEAFVLELSRKVPAIQEFGYGWYYLSPGSDTAFLATVLRNLVEVNPKVNVLLFLGLEFQHGDGALVDQLLTVPVRVTELSIDSDTRNKPHELRKILTWIGGHRDWLKKLTFCDESGEKTHEDGDRDGLEFPPLHALESLDYVQSSRVSLLQYKSPGHFPKLRCVGTVLTGNDFTVPLPTVTDLTLIQSPLTALAARNPLHRGNQLYSRQPFPNVTKLTCPAVFLNFRSLRDLGQLATLHVTLDVREVPVERHIFWRKVTKDAPMMTLDQIRSLPEPPQSPENRSLPEPAQSPDNRSLPEPVEAPADPQPGLKDLKSLKYFAVDLGLGQEVAQTQLAALLFISKLQQIQRLDKVELFFENSNVLPNSYLEDLRKYHFEVVFSTSKKG